MDSHAEVVELLDSSSDDDGGDHVDRRVRTTTSGVTKRGNLGRYKTGKRMVSRVGMTTGGRNNNSAKKVKTSSNMATVIREIDGELRKNKQARDEEQQRKGREQQRIAKKEMERHKENFINHYKCQITKALSHDYVSASDGFNYDRDGFLKYVHDDRFNHRANVLSPMTGKPINREFARNTIWNDHVRDMVYSGQYQHDLIDEYKEKDKEIQFRNDLRLADSGDAEAALKVGDIYRCAIMQC